jgi:hypothetical protein
VTDWTEIEQARAKAHAKHGENSIEGITAADPRWLSILVEEGGETSEATLLAWNALLQARIGRVAHEQTYDARGSLRGEIVDVLAVASAWLDAVDGAAPAAAADPGALPRVRREAGDLARLLRQRSSMTKASSGDVRVMRDAADVLEEMSQVELDNHHNAAACPYCTPDPAQREPATGVDIMREFRRG